MSDDAAHEMVARAVDRIDAEDATGGPHNHLEGKAVAGWLTPEIDAQLEFEREQGLSPELERPAASWGSATAAEVPRSSRRR